MTQEPPKSFSQDELDRIVEDRIARERASKWPDYDTVKAKADQLEGLQVSHAAAIHESTSATAALESESVDLRVQLNGLRLDSALAPRRPRAESSTPRPPAR